MYSKNLSEEVTRRDVCKYLLDEGEDSGPVISGQTSSLDGRVFNINSFPKGLADSYTMSKSTEDLPVAANGISSKSWGKCVSERGIFNGTALGNSTVPTLTRSDRLHLRNRMRNIREQFASLLQTLHTNEMLASTAFEVFNDHADDLLADILPSTRTESEGSDGASEHSTNDDDLRELAETPVSVSLPPSP